MLEAAKAGGINKTKVMFRAYLSQAQLKDYLTMLIENGLLENDPVNHTYHTTDKGIKFLSVYNQLGQIVSTPMG